MKSKSTTAVLAFFLGGIGIHRFYLGENGIGLVYFLMSWTFIPAFIAMLETFYFLLMSDQEFNRKYNLQMQYLPAPEPYRAPQRHQQAPQQIGQNVTVNLSGANGGGGTQVDVADQLGKLNDLRVAGALTDEEFLAQKRKLLT